MSVGSLGVNASGQSLPSGVVGAAVVPLAPTRKIFCTRHVFSPSSRSCSGNAFGSAAAANASIDSRAACAWLPWLFGDGSIVKTTSGRVVRMTRTRRSRVSSWPQICSVSGALSVYQKSTLSR